MRFKVYQATLTAKCWWLFDPDKLTLKEREAFVFDSSNQKHIDNLVADWDSACVIKLVNK